MKHNLRCHQPSAEEVCLLFVATHTHTHPFPLEHRPTPATAIDPTTTQHKNTYSSCNNTKHRLGAGVKVINCVLMDDVAVGDGSHIQNCVICAGAVVQERATLKDCQVRYMYVCTYV